MSRIRDEAWILLLGAVFFLPFLGGVHLFDWDEINFAECAREMLETGNVLQVQIDYQPFWEKPPLFIWMQAASMSVFGVGEYAARLPNALCGIATLLLLYHMGLQLQDRRFAWTWVWLYLGSVLPHLYFKSGIIDPWFNLFMFGALYAITRIRIRPGQSGRWAAWAGLSLGLAVLTKGPVAVLLVGLTGLGYALWQGFRALPAFKHLLLLGLVALLVPLAWFGVDIYHNGLWFTETFIRYQYRLFSTPDAGHAGFPGYHLVVLLLGCFPASALLFARSSGGSEPQADFRRWMWVLLAVVLLVFSLVQSKIVHYSSLAYFPITFLAAGVVWRLRNKQQALPVGLRLALWSIAAIWATLVLALPLVLKYRLEWLQAQLFKDPFAQANLTAPVEWTGWEALPALLLLLAVWGFVRGMRLGKAWAVPVLALGMVFFLQGVLIGFVGRVEGYSQRTVIHWYQELAGQPVYVRPMGFKSYAHLFYTRRGPDYPDQGRDLQQLLHAPLERDAWFITKSHRPMGLDTLPDVQEVERKHGFSLYRRAAQ